MKKFTFIVLIACFVTAQSFHKSFKREKITAPAYFKYFPNQVSVCVPVYNEADQETDITALKGWGNYKWKIESPADSTQYYFNQGLSMYYAFHSIEAIASFTKATHLDSNCAMAWYGKALAMGPTINYPNGYRPPSGALDAAVKSQKLSAGCSSLEKDLINAMQQRYSADTTISTKQLRINYADAMQKVYTKYQKNADVITLYADALLLLHPWDLYTHDFKPKTWTPQIQSLLEQAIAVSPSHPGANHYYIHTMEGSATPGAATKSAHLLDTLMPKVAHITHMPSHIYIRTGDYQRGITVNDAAVAGFAVYAKQYAPVMNGFALYKAHNIHLKINCAEMAGNYKIAMDESASLQKQIPPFYLSLKDADGNYVQYIYMQPLLVDVRFGKWDNILKLKPIDSLAYVSVLQHFARGMAFSRKGNQVEAKQELEQLNQKMLDKALKYKMDNFSTAYEAAVVARFILQGVVAEEQKQYDLAIDFLQKAVVSEDNLVYNEPRDWPIPARQYLAEALIKAGKYNEATAVLNKDLAINPENGWSLTGLELVYQKTANNIALKKVQQQLKSAWKIKDVEIEQAVF